MMFSRTVSDGNTPRPWMRWHMPSLARALGFERVTSVPSSKTRPVRGRKRPEAVFKAVVLPAPFGPMSAATSVARTEIETLRKTVTRP